MKTDFAFYDDVNRFWCVSASKTVWHVRCCAVPCRVCHSLCGKGCRYWFLWWFCGDVYIMMMMKRSFNICSFSKWDLFSSSLCQQKVILISMCAWVKLELRLTPNLCFCPSCNIICVISSTPSWWETKGTNERDEIVRTILRKKQRKTKTLAKFSIPKSTDGDKTHSYVHYAWKLLFSLFKRKILFLSKPKVSLRTTNRRHHMNEQKLLASIDSQLHSVHWHWVWCVS